MKVPPTSPKMHEIRNRKPPDLHSSFLDWVQDTYAPSEQATVIDNFIQNGTYPSEFLFWWRSLV